MGAQTRNGVTLVELLVVIAIVSVLVALLIPAVQAAREAARRTQCQSNLRQIGLAVAQHESAHGHYPTNGWGFRWVGDPDGGFEANQPGGWIYNVLPYVEAAAVREKGKQLPAAGKRSAMAEVLASPVAVFQCPARRTSTPYPYDCWAPLVNAADPTYAAKGDYAINAGDTYVIGGPGPDGSDRQSLLRYRWPDSRAITGISFVRTRLRPANVADGTSQVYLAGERYVPQGEYASGKSIGDDQTMYVGDDADVRRWTADPPKPDSAREDTKTEFGGPHSGICYFVFCDGAVHAVRYSIDPTVHKRLGNRKDGGVVEVGEL
jgi:prepilin-type N-terminal cleavage/methylation domain-containing protein